MKLIQVHANSHAYTYKCTHMHIPDLSRVFLCVASMRSLAMKCCSSSVSEEKSG